eukprot:CAMPEP_0203763008 /NCGR_PEP_ID=MMETSP0098-20131031/15741_1 /ASSEMBLY_ACC=CAM_ASM_000208 /TAXON_ID=96639 /ORGANISM=" , Strain NY0313808BC1" /LENGTH=577 /DNA_ID=CAMNT_0050657611 /DNA_START=68 /DNA_END=1801 /DNA_ORIENTATION=+
MSDSVMIPYELMDWVQSPEGAELIDKVRVKANVISINWRSHRPGRADLVVVAASPDSMRAAKSLLEMHLNFQVEYELRKRQTAKMEQDLQATNAEFESGRRVEFSVQEQLIGLVIGKGGANVAKVKEQTGVDKVVVDTKTRVVRIRGDDPEGVQRAREMLEFQEFLMPLNNSQIKFVIGEKGRNINDVWKKSGCISVNVEDPPEGTESAADKVLKIIGTKKAVDLARSLVETQLEFENKMKNLRDKDMNIKRELNKIDSNYKESGSGSYVRGGGGKRWSGRNIQQHSSSPTNSDGSKNGGSFRQDRRPAKQKQGEDIRSQQQQDKDLQGRQERRPAKQKQGEEARSQQEKETVGRQDKRQSRQKHGQDAQVHEKEVQARQDKHSAKQKQGGGQVQQQQEKESLSSDKGGRKTSKQKNSKNQSAKANKDLKSTTEAGNDKNEKPPVTTSSSKSKKRQPKAKGSASQAQQPGAPTTPAEQSKQTSASSRKGGKKQSHEKDSKKAPSPPEPTTKSAPQEKTPSPKHDTEAAIENSKPDSVNTRKPRGNRKPNKKGARPDAAKKAPEKKKVLQTSTAENNN